MIFLKKLIAWIRGPLPMSLEPLSMLPKIRRTSPTSKLYLIHTQHEVGEEYALKIKAALEPLREKYGIDFLLIEPGMKITRFDDI